VDRSDVFADAWSIIYSSHGYYNGLIASSSEAELAEKYFL